MCQHPQLRIKIVWIPGHFGIEGNESADTEAKRAALNPTLSQPLKYKPLKSARIRNIKAAAKEQWWEEWHGNKKTSNKLRHITKQKGVKTGTKLYNTLPSRRAVAMIARLRTGYCKLNHYMYRFKIKDSPYCECGNGKETVEHYLLECRKYNEQRKKLRREVGPGRMRMEKLLGYPKLVKHTLEFVANTKGEL